MASELRHRLNGLVVASNVPLPGVPRTTSSQIDLTVTLAEGAAPPPRGVVLQGSRLFTIYDNHPEFWFVFPDGVYFRIDACGTEVHGGWPSALDASIAVLYLVNTVIAFVLRLRGAEVLHGCSAVIDGRAVAIVGPSGSGKSTLAAALARRGFTVLAEDVTVVLEDGDGFATAASHSRLRLWPDAAKLLYERELPYLADRDWKTYAELDGDLDALAAQRFELAALYSLDDRRDVPAPRVEPLSRRDALLDVLANTYHNLGEARFATRSFERAGRLVARLPVRLAVPSRDLRTVLALADAIVDDFRALTQAA
ncbi:MAG TPA: AAA family ATPase [Thermoanaerobaculia bacterium]|jgi:hypothetical protein